MLAKTKNLINSSSALISFFVGSDVLFCECDSTYVMQIKKMLLVSKRASVRDHHHDSCTHLLPSMKEVIIQRRRFLFKHIHGLISNIFVHF